MKSRLISTGVVCCVFGLEVADVWTLWDCWGDLASEYIVGALAYKEDIARLYSVRGYIPSQA